MYLYIKQKYSVTQLLKLYETKVLCSIFYKYNIFSFKLNGQFDTITRLINGLTSHVVSPV